MRARFKIYNRFFRALYNLNWIGDTEEYLKQLTTASQGVSKVFEDRLPYLKISIVGPQGVEETLNHIDLSDLTSFPNP